MRVIVTRNALVNLLAGQSVEVAGHEARRLILLGIAEEEKKKPAPAKKKR